jgi:DNA-binding CsgD family transcriptional regulator
MYSLIYENIVLINSIVIFAMGIFILRIEPKNKLNILFFIKCLIFSIYIFSSIPEIFANKENVFLFYKIRMCLGGASIYIGLCFFIELAAPDTKKIIKYLLLIPALIAILITGFSDISYFNVIRINDIFKIIPDYTKSYFLYLPFYLASYGVSICILLYKWNKNSKSNKDKKQSGLILSVSIIFILTIIISDNILSSFSFLKFPYLAPPLFLLYIAAIFYALIKYRFLSFSKRDIVQEIFSNVQDMILILNPDRTLMDVNNNYRTRLSGTDKDIAGKKFEELISNDENILIKFDELVSGKIKSFNTRIIYKALPENIITDSYLLRIVDKFNDFVAILIVSRENLGIKHLKKQYKITNRQLEIIQMTIDGLSNDEISERLSLARRTIETHLHYIYNKLSVKNKIELMKLANDFNLIANK